MSNIRTIIKNADNIKASATTELKLSAIKVTRSRNHLLEKMERRLSIWVDDQTQQNMPISKLIIMEKARSIFRHIQEEGDMSDTFTASRGSFDRFKQRNNLHSIRITGEAASADKKAAQKFPATLKAIIEHGNYPLQLVSMWMKQAFYGKECLLILFSLEKRNVHLGSKLQRTN
jgi:hypothetical protein